MITDNILMGKPRREIMYQQIDMHYRPYLAYKLECMQDAYRAYVDKNWTDRYDLEGYDKMVKAWVVAISLIEKQIASNKAMDKRGEENE